MRHFYIICLILCLPIILSAQKKRSPFQKFNEKVGKAHPKIGFSIGLSFPIDRYSADRELNESAFAKMGWSATLDGAYLFTDNIGLSGVLGVFMNGVDSDAYIKQLLLRLPEGSVSGGFKNIPLWRNYYLGIGPYIALPEGNFEFEISAFTGLLMVHAPAYEFEGEYDGRPLLDTKTADNSASYVFGASLKLNYHVSKNLRAFVAFEFVSGSPSLDRTILTETGEYHLDIEVKQKQAISILNIGLGIALELGK